MKRTRDEEKSHDYAKKCQKLCEDEAQDLVVKDGDILNASIRTNVIAENKWTELHYVALNGHVDVAKMLIQNGADVNAVNKNKSTALHFADEKRHLDFAKMLIQNGADVNAVDKNKWTPLHRAAGRGHVDAAKVLIQNGADVNAVTNDSQTALYHAAGKWCCIDFTLRLLCFGATIDKEALEEDETGLLGPINDRIKLLRAGKRPETSLMSSEEREWMWNLAFSFTTKYPAAAFKAYYTIRSFITFHGIFMGYGYDLGDKSVWE